MHRSQGFNSFDHFNAFDHGWNVDFRAAQAGDYIAHIEQFVGNRVLVNIGTFDQGTLQKGSTPRGMRTFALPMMLGGRATWLDYEVETQSLMLFPNSGELSCLADGTMKMLTLSVEEDLVEEVGNTQLQNATPVSRSEQVGALESDYWLQLQQRVRMLITFNSRYGQLPESNNWSAYMEEELAASFVSCLPQAANSCGPLTPSAAARNTRHAISHIMDNLGQPLSTGSICRIVGCSRRTLETSFKRSSGYSIQSFIKHQRLAHCREELVKSAPGTVTVTSVARQWGFWHMGQFSMDYRKLFAEKPSSTLARSPLRPFYLN